MKKVLGILLPLVFLCSLSSVAQNKFTKAADESFADQQYLLALTRYQKAYSKIKKNKEEKERISFRMAECYRMMNNTKKAEIAYKRLLTSKYIKKEPRIYLYYANALKSNGNYDEAINQYKAYQAAVPDDKRGEMGISSCNLAKEWIKNPTKYDVQWEKKINTKDDEFAPDYADKTHSTIIFTSDRNGSVGKDIDNWTGLEFSDLFIARKDRKGDWSTPVPADQSGTLNTKANEGAAKFNSRYTVLYFTRCYNAPEKKNGCGIYRIPRLGAQAWGDPEKIDLGGDSTTVMGHPTVTSDENTLYFAADLPGGYGGKDIWMVTRAKGKGKGTWSHPINLGADINTAGDELFPYIRDDSILYYSSNGLPGMGGLDIFRSVRVNDKWSPPENLKYPINSPGDDFGITFNPDEPEEGYFSSNRPGGKGRDDILSFVVPPLVFTLEGTVTDDLTLQPVQGAKVRITGTNGKMVDYNTDEKGHYSFNKNQIAPNTTYDILVTRKDYFNEKAKETTVGLEKSKDLEHNLVLKPIPKKPVVLPDILYDLNKWDLKPQFRDSLQGLIETLDANENIVVELAAHTDSRNTDEYNDVLSQKRAQSVVDYLVSRGIDPDRLVAKGYGKRVPRTLTKDIVKDGFLFKAGTVLTDSLINSLPNTQAKEAAHSLNRRTEFSILRNDFVPKPTGVKVAPAKIEIVQNPEENNVAYSITADGNLEASCIVNGQTMNFDYDKNEKEFFISMDAAIRMLKSGIIDKNDFKGDVTKILGEGTIADKAVFTIHEMRIGNNTVKDLEVTVNKKLRVQLLMGENTLSRFGSFTIDQNESKFIFK
ncbi:MAG TPA: OmpA family protein [Bacteroidales bacterium]|nr:OmpA family protein [Bacteroidales bacterium]